MKVETLPIIDISGLRAGEGQAAMEVGRQINEACASIGFFYVTDHGVAAETINEAVNAGKEFFHLPLEEKRRVAVDARHRGFNALGDATMYGASRPDYKEFYSMGLELAADDADVVAGEPLRGRIIGPSNRRNFALRCRPTTTRLASAEVCCFAVWH